VCCARACVCVCVRACVCVCAARVFVHDDACIRVPRESYAPHRSVPAGKQSGKKRTWSNNGSTISAAPVGEAVVGPNVRAGQLGRNLVYQRRSARGVVGSGVGDGVGGLVVGSRVVSGGVGGLGSPALVGGPVLAGNRPKSSCRRSEPLRGPAHARRLRHGGSGTFAHWDIFDTTASTPMHAREPHARTTLAHAQTACFHRTSVGESFD
jgi:hypothetical protein